MSTKQAPQKQKESWLKTGLKSTFNHACSFATGAAASLTGLFTASNTFLYHFQKFADHSDKGNHIRSMIAFSKSTSLPLLYGFLATAIGGGLAYYGLNRHGFSELKSRSAWSGAAAGLLAAGALTYMIHAPDTETESNENIPVQIVDQEELTSFAPKPSLNVP